NSENPLHETVIRIDANMTPMNLSAGKTMAGANNYLAELEIIWKQKELHGRFAAALYNETIDIQLSTAYLKQVQ
ncbi:hypothetical protein HHI36_010703, partial [Cryptolaemus montrouzieri]